MARGTVDARPLIEEPELLLNFFREMRRPAFYNSNVFYRDIEFAIRDYFQAEEGKSLRNPEAERIANDVIHAWMEQGILRQVNRHAFVLLHKDYLTPKEGTVGLLNVPLDKLPASAIPLPTGSPVLGPEAASAQQNV